MPKKGGASAEEIVRRELGDHGIIGRLSLKRDGDKTVALLEFTDARNMNRVAKLVGVGRLEGQEVAFGLDVPEGALRDILFQAFDAAGALRDIVPFEVDLSP